MEKAEFDIYKAENLCLYFTLFLDVSYLKFYLQIAPQSYWMTHYWTTSMKKTE